LLVSGTIYHGGRHDRADRFIAPTVLVDVSPDSPVMQEEIFGPILPVLEVDTVRQVIDFVNARPSPLGLYVFAEDQRRPDCRVPRAGGSPGWLVAPGATPPALTAAEVVDVRPPW
jgi:acyl-CoA reductase-like NAD-dependent aldehyde dehydrogenase